MTHEELERQLSKKFNTIEPDRLLGSEIKPSEIYLVKFALYSCELEDPLFPAYINSVSRHFNEPGAYTAEVTLMDETFTPKLTKSAGLYCGYWDNVDEQIEIEDDDRGNIYIPKFATLRQFGGNYPLNALPNLVCIN
jgi:hypothetical protein